MTYAIISGTGMAVPEKKLTNTDLAKMVDTNDAWVVQRTGIKQRRIAVKETAVSLAYDASQKAIEAAGLVPSDLDTIIVGTFTPDQNLPSAACRLQAKLNAQHASANDVNAACSGFIYALKDAYCAIKAKESRYALVVGVDLCSRFVDYNDRDTCILFGDGAGAVIVQAADAPGILAVTARADGSQGNCLELNADDKITMDGRTVYKFAVRTLATIAHETVSKAGIAMKDIDLFIPHQANARIIESVADELGIANTYVNVQDYGNTSAGSIPIALDECVRQGNVKKGQHVLLASVGAGLTWGAAVMRWT